MRTSTPHTVAALALVTIATVTGCAGGDDGGDAEPAVDTSSATATATATTMTGTGDRAQIPVVIDYSPTLSDVTALLYLAEHPAVDLLAVTLAGTGESHCEAAVPNTVALLELAGHPEIPVACGSTDPIGPGSDWPEEWRTAADDLPGLDLPDVDGPELANPELDTATDLLAEIAGSTDDLVVVALGPLTNLAMAIDRHPSLVDDVAMLYSMGGAIDVAGNVPNGTSEWNYFVDPVAVDTVVRSGIPMTLVPLDATNDVPVTADWFSRLEEEPVAPSADAVRDLFRTGRPWDFQFFFWDELTAAIAVDRSLASIDEVTIHIETDGSDAGRTVLDQDGTSIGIASAPDRERFESELLSILDHDDNG